MTRYGNTYTCGSNTACVTTVSVFTRKQDKLLISIQCVYISNINANIFFIEPHLLSALFIIKHQQTTYRSALSASTSTLGDLCTMQGDAVPSIITIIKSMPVNMSLELGGLGVNDRSVEM